MSFDSVMGKTIYPVKSIAVGCDFISGYAFKGKDFTDADGHPIIKIKNIQDGKVTIKESQFIPKHLTGKKLEKFKLENGDILIAMTGQGSVGRVGKLYISTTETPYLNQRVGKFLVDEENLNKEYLYYVLSCKAYENYLFAAGSGSGQPNLSPALIKAVEIPYPPYKSQCYIGKILSDLDDKIHLNNQINQTLESIAQAIFKSWFIDFDPVRAKIAAKQNDEDPELAAMCAISGKSEEELQQMSEDDFAELQATAALFPEEFVESELGEVPKGWLKTDLSILADLNSQSWSKKNYPKKVSYVDLSNTKWGVIQQADEFNFENAPSRARRILKIGDTIVGTVRPSNGSYAFIQQENLTGSTGFAVLSPKKVIYAEFIYIASTDEENIKRLAHLADGGAYPAVSYDTVLNTPCILPIKDNDRDGILNLFHKNVKVFYLFSKSKFEENKTLENTRDSLLPKLLSGEMDVSGLQIEVA